MVFLVPRCTLHRLSVSTFSGSCSSHPHLPLTFSAGFLQVFNRRVKRIQRERAAVQSDASRQVDYLRDEVATRLCERILDIDRHFDHALDLGANACNLARALSSPVADSIAPSSPSQLPSSRISQLTAIDSSSSLLFRDADLPFNSSISITREVVEDEELVAYSPDTFDIVLSSLSLHWINDLPSLFARVNNMLKPDSPLLAAMFGGDTLYELRTSLQLASIERQDGISLRLSPLADVRDVGGLLSQAGFRMLTVDVDDIVVNFPDVYSLLVDLQAMGESNALVDREPGPIQRDLLRAAEGTYRSLHGNEDGTLPATFRIIYMIAWKEGQGQRQPLLRGSADLNLKDVLEGRSPK